MVGPEYGRAATVRPITYELDEMHEVVGNGTLVPDESGKTLLHCHIACGRKGHTVCGDVRAGVIVWHIVEVVLTEIIGCVITSYSIHYTKLYEEHLHG